MLTFTLELTDRSSSQAVHGLSRGHISVQGSQGIVTSKGRTPDQSMFIFLSIVDLLDGLSGFFEGSRSRRYAFVGNDSSFQLSIEPVKGRLFRISSQAQTIDTITQDELIRAIWQGVTKFLERYQEDLSDGDMIYSDLISSIAEFRLSFDL